MLVVCYKSCYTKKQGEPYKKEHRDTHIIALYINSHRNQYSDDIYMSDVSYPITTFSSVLYSNTLVSCFISFIRLRQKKFHTKKSIPVAAGMDECYASTLSACLALWSAMTSAYHFALSFQIRSCVSKSI